MIDELFEITIRSLAISGTATLLAGSWSIPSAYLISRSSRLSKILMPIVEAIVGLPTVLVGLLMYMLLCGRGPLGILNLLYTPYAITVGQAILISPLLISTSFRVLAHAQESYGELALTLGATERQAMQLVLVQSLPGLMASIVMSFSRALGELGVALMIGGNIRGYTRVITTAIALEVSRGEFELALMLGGVLVILLVAVSMSLRTLRRLQIA